LARLVLKPGEPKLLHEWVLSGHPVFFKATKLREPNFPKQGSESFAPLLHYKKKLFSFGINCKSILIRTIHALDQKYSLTKKGGHHEKVITIQLS